MRTEQVNVYSFEELGEEVQKKVISNMAGMNVDYELWDSIFEDAKAIDCEISEFDINHGGYINFSANGEVTAKAILQYHGKDTDTYQLAEAFLKELERLEAEFDRTEAVYIELSHKDHLYDFEQSILNSADSLLDKIDDQLQEIVDEFEQQLGECYLVMLRNEYYYLISDEAIREAIISNGYEFTADRPDGPVAVRVVRWPSGWTCSRPDGPVAVRMDL